MDGWMDGWVGRGVGGWMGGWIDGSMGIVRRGWSGFSLSWIWVQWLQHYCVSLWLELIGFPVPILLMFGFTL